MKLGVWLSVISAMVCGGAWAGTSPSRIEIGNLKVSKGRLVDQAWSISQDGAKLSIAVESSAEFQVDVEAFAVLENEFTEIDTQPSSKLLDAPHAILASVRGEKKRDGLRASTLTWIVQPGANAKKPYRLEVAWSYPVTSATVFSAKDEATRERFCVDKSTAKALAKKTKSYFSVGLRLNETSVDPFQLKILARDLPTSYCDRKRAPAGLLSILFGAAGS